MTASGKTVRILFLDGQERTFTQAFLDKDAPGWLHLTRLQVDEGPLSGVMEPIAGYRLETVKGWEYVEESEEGHGEDTRTNLAVSG